MKFQKKTKCGNSSVDVDDTTEHRILSTRKQDVWQSWPMFQDIT